MPRPSGRLGKKTYIELGSKYLSPSKFKTLVTAISKREAKKEVTKEIGHAGRPQSTAQSMRVLGGHLRVKLAKHRAIRVNGKMVRV